jgi:hypothetical protein
VVARRKRTSFSTIQSKRQRQIILANALLFAVLLVAFFLSKDFSVYLRSVATHWLSLMGGAVSVGITFWEKVRRTIGKYVLFSIAVLCVFWSGFRAWQEEHNRVDLNAPHLHIIAQAVYAIPDASNSLLVILMHIKNTGAPSTVDNPQANVVLPNGAVIQGKWLPRPQEGIVVKQPNGAAIKFSSDDFLTGKAGERPIATNGAVEGYFWVKLEGVKHADVANSIVRVTIRDSLGQTYSQDTRMGQNLDIFNSP